MQAFYYILTKTFVQAQQLCTALEKVENMWSVDEWRTSIGTGLPPYCPGPHASRIGMPLSICKHTPHYPSALEVCLLPFHIYNLYVSCTISLTLDKNTLAFSIIISRQIPVANKLHFTKFIPVTGHHSIFQWCYFPWQHNYITSQQTQLFLLP